MIYTRDNIHDLVNDIKNYTKAPHKPNWCIVTDENGEEYIDDRYWITDGFTLWFVPKTETAPSSKLRKVLSRSELRGEYEDDIAKMLRNNEPVRRPTKKLIESQLLKYDDFLLAESFELDFHPLSGFSVLCKTKGDRHGRLDLRYLLRYEKLAVEFSFFEGFTIEVSQSSGLVQVVKDNFMLGISAPIVGQEDIPY